MEGTDELQPNLTVCVLHNRPRPQPLLRACAVWHKLKHIKGGICFGVLKGMRTVKGLWPPLLRITRIRGCSEIPPHECFRSITGVDATKCSSTLFPQDPFQLKISSWVRISGSHYSPKTH